MDATPWPLAKLAARRPTRLKPAVTAAAVQPSSPPAARAPPPPGPPRPPRARPAPAPREPVRHRDDPRRGVERALAARGAGDAAEPLGGVALEQALALHEELVLDRHQDEEILRAGLDAVAAGGAAPGGDYGQPDGVHADRVEGARDRAVREPEAPPHAALPAH